MEEKKSMKELLRAVKFGLFSVSAGIIQILSFELLNLIFKDWDYWPKYLIALILSVLWNFTLNRKYTFKSANNVPVAMMKVAAYYLVFTPVTTIGGDWVTKNLLWNETLVLIITMVLNFVTEFLFDKYVVFRNSIDTNDVAMKDKEKNKNQEEK